MSAAEGSRWFLIVGLVVESLQIDVEREQLASGAALDLEAIPQAHGQARTAGHDGQRSVWDWRWAIVDPWDG